MSPEQTIAEIKRETFEAFKDSPRVWMIEERGAEFIVHCWYGGEWKNGAGVGPPHSYPTLRKAAARFLQMLGVGPVAPQTWPEEVCIGEISLTE
jgi:hypothetical protein